MAKCPNCNTSIPLDATECKSCNASFEGELAWRPTPETPTEEKQLAKYLEDRGISVQNTNRKPSGKGLVLVLFGLLVAAICPVAFGIGMGLWHFMPDCKVGSGGPAYGCLLLGIDISWLMQLLVVLGFLGSFFLVPIGGVIIIVGILAAAFGGREVKQA